METINETKKVTTLLEAYEYINERYIFDGKHYPVMYGMNNRDRVVFALKHSFLHMYKNIGPIVVMHEKVNGVIGGIFQNEPPLSVMGIGPMYKIALVKTIINFIKIAEIVGISKNEITDISSNDSALSIYDACSQMMHTLAVVCENADHNNNDLHHSEVVLTFSRSWAGILSSFEKENILMPYHLIPGYMKSK